MEVVSDISFYNQALKRKSLIKFHVAYLTLKINVFLHHILVVSGQFKKREEDIETNVGVLKQIVTIQIF